MRRGLVKGTSMVEDIEVKFRISKMKPLYVSWLIDFFNELTSPNDKKVITSGWRRSEILDAITLSLKKPTPSEEVDSLETSKIPGIPQLLESNINNEEEAELCADEIDKSDWQVEETENLNAFDMFNELKQKNSQNFTLIFCCISIDFIVCEFSNIKTPKLLCFCENAKLNKRRRKV